MKVSPCQVSKLLLYGVRTLNWVKRLHSELSSVVVAVVKQFAYARRAFKTIDAKQLQRGMARGEWELKGYRERGRGDAKAFRGKLATNA